MLIPDAGIGFIYTGSQPGSWGQKNIGSATLGVGHSGVLKPVLWIRFKFQSVDAGPVYEFRSVSRMALPKWPSKSKKCENFMLQELSVLSTGWQAFPVAWRTVF
jgi:hypothetical protein